MTGFRYKALTLSGEMVTGLIEAGSESAAIQEVRQLGHYPVSATLDRSEIWHRLIARLRLAGSGASRRNVGIAVSELAALLNAGLDLEQALEMLAGMEETKGLSAHLTRVLTRIRNGSNLADALAEEAVFPKFCVSMVRAGEMTGTLPAALERASQYFAKTEAISEAITSALVYPIILLVSAGFSIGFILIFVLPEFEELFQNAGHALPLPTRIAIGAGHLLRDYWWALAVVVIASTAAIRASLRRADQRLKWDALLLRLPLLGALFVRIESERFCRTLGTLLERGIALPSALGIAREAITNTVISDAARLASTSLREGERLAARFARAKVFPALCIDLMRVGEETSKLDEMLLHYAELSERNTKHMIDRLLALIVPALTVVLGLVIAGLIASMLSAILSVNDLALQ